MQTQWVGGEGDNFASALANFEAATGIDVTVAEVPSGQHETLVNVSLNGGAAADLIMLAQPAAIKQYGDAGLLVDIATIMDTEKLAAEHAATLPLYTSGESIWAMPYKVDVKSVVWYPIKAFEDRGYAVPTTWDELTALSDQIIADGEGSPWCIGIDAGSATGWIITDWIEDIMLRTAGVDAYNKWITHELPFMSPEVKNALDVAGKIFFTPGLRARRQHGHPGHLAGRRHGSHVQRRHGQPRLLDAEAGHLVRPRLLPGCQGRRRHAASTSSARTSASSTCRPSTRPWAPRPSAPVTP